MSFAHDDLWQLAATDEVEIETQAPEGAVHRTTIWVVVDRDEVFIRSFRGATARWYRDALANPAVAVDVQGKRLSATAIAATDPDSIERVSAALWAKYPKDPATKAMVAPDVLDTTLRLEPT